MAHPHKILPKKWLEDEDLNGFIEAVPDDPSVYYCNICKGKYKVVSITHVKRHLTSKDHLINLKKKFSFKPENVTMMEINVVEPIQSAKDLFAEFRPDSNIEYVAPPPNQSTFSLPFEEKPKIIVKDPISFNGLLCPVFTPFENQRGYNINMKLLAPYSKYLHENGVKGVLINDIVGEGMSLTPDERKKLTEHWSLICQDTGQFLMVQIGGAPLKSVMDMASHAEKLKVGAIVILPDLYNRPKNHKDVIKYIRMASRNCYRPILYHHNPSYTKVKLDLTQFLLDVTKEVDYFAGLICSGNDLSDALSIKALNPVNLSMFIGTDEVIIGAVSSGIDGIMASSLNILPKEVESLYQYTKNGELANAQVVQTQLKKVLDYIYSCGDQVAALKATMLVITKMPMIITREPLETFREAQIIFLKSKLPELGVN